MMDIERSRWWSSVGAGAVAATVRRDRVVHVLILSLLVILVLYLLPGTNEGKRLITRHVAPLTVLSLTVAAVFLGLGSIPYRNSRLFWSGVGVAFSLWLSVRLMFLPTGDPPLFMAFLADLLYAGFYLILVLTIDGRPHLQTEWPFRSFERALRWSAIFFFVLGLLAYFVLLPVVVERSAYETFVPSMFLFIALDVYLAVKLTLYAFTTKSQHWRMIYVLLGCSLAALAANDTIEALHYSETIIWPWGSVGDVFFLSPFLFAILAARSRKFLPAEGERTDPASDEPLRSLAEQLISYALMLPLIHFSGYLLGVFDERVHEVREALVFTWLILIGGIAILQHSLLARRARHFASESTRTAEALRESEDRVRLILERQQAREAQRVSELKFTRVFQSSPDPLLIATVPTGVLLDVNETFLAATRFRRDAVVGKRIADLGLLSASSWLALSSIMAENGRVRNFEADFKLPSGRVVASLISSEPCELDGQPCVIVTARDITERRRFEAIREKLIAELEEKNEELSRFTYTVSHDLKSPLITIRGFLGLLEQDAVSGEVERVRADVEQIRGATAQMQRLLDELLELSRIGRITHTPRNIEMDEIVEQCLRILSGQIEERGVRVEVADRLPVVYGDRVRILQLLQNLVDNAVKFMGDQREPVIRIGWEEVDGRTIFHVEDNGIGIDPRFSEKVFGLFERLDPEGPGTGVGLAIVKRIVEYHGGRVWLESEGPGKGSKFCFSLPSATDVETEIVESLEL